MAPVVAVIAIAVVTGAAIITAADCEVGAATTVDPNAAVVEAPGLAVNTGSFTALANEADAAVGADWAAVDVEVVGRTIKGASAAVVVVVGVVAGADGEIGAATAVDPDAVAGNAPGAAVNAGGFALLANDFDAAVSVDGAEVAIEIVGGAVELVGMRTGHGGKRAGGRWIESRKNQNDSCQGTEKYEKSFHDDRLRAIATRPANGKGRGWVQVLVLR